MTDKKKHFVPKKMRIKKKRMK